MRSLFIFIFLMSVCTAGFSQYSYDVTAGYIFGRLGGFDGTQDYTGTYLGGMTWYKQISKGKYTANAVAICAGWRFVRSGYMMSGYAPYPSADFYTRYDLREMRSSYRQNYVSIPLGIDFQFRARPARRPQGYSSVKLLFNNSILLSSTLKEGYENSSYDEVSRKSDVTKYAASKYFPGLTLEGKIEFITVGISWQQMKYNIPAGDLNIDETTGSPFQEVFTSNGKYNDFYMYVGGVFLIKSERGKIKHQGR